MYYFILLFPRVSSEQVARRVVSLQGGSCPRDPGGRSRFVSPQNALYCHRCQQHHPHHSSQRCHHQRPQRLSQSIHRSYCHNHPLCPILIVIVNINIILTIVLICLYHDHPSFLKHLDIKTQHHSR